MLHLANYQILIPSDLMALFSSIFYFSSHVLGGSVAQLATQ